MSCDVKLTGEQTLQIKRIKDQYDSCTFENFTLKLLIEDFNDKLTNCIFRGECPNYDTLMIVMTVCYAYCLLKCCILFMVWFYQRNRVKSISNNIQQDSPQNQQNQQNQQSQENQQNDQKRNTVKYILDKESFEELKTYEISINLNIFVEILMAIRDFFLFRGLGYFTSYLYQVVFVVNQKGQDAQCISSSPDFDCKNVTLNDIYFYLTSADICVIRFPFFSLSGEDNIDQQYVILYTYIIIWIVLECSASSILFFNTQVLSYVNEGGKEQKVINSSIKKYSISFFFGQVIIMCILIFGFKIRLYFRFQSVEVLIYYLVWKSLGFMLLLDQYNKKQYLSKKLQIDIAYDKGMDWEKNEQKNYEKAQGIPQENGRDLVSEMRKEYLACLNRIHLDLLVKCIEKDKQRKKKIKFQWDSYLFFVLVTLLFGIFGYSCCLIHYSINQDSATQKPANDSLFNLNDLNSQQFQFGKYLNAQALFWLGFVFCMLESAIFEIFNSVLLLHSYYLQLFEQMALKPNDQQTNTSIHEQNN